MMDFFEYTFNEDTWRIYIIESDDNVIADENAGAETSFEKKEIYFREDHISLGYVLHEIFHVYFGYCYLNDTTNMILSDIEEVCAELFSDKAERMIERAKDVLTKLEQLKEQNEED